jgi:spore germination protein KB
MKLNPEKDIFQIIDTLFGKVFAKILILLMFWYSLHLFSLVIYNFGAFAEIIAMSETPQLAIMLIMILLDAYIVKRGAEALGKW